MRDHLIPVRTAIIKKKKNLQIINSGEGMEKMELSYTLGGNAT